MYVWPNTIINAIYLILLFERAREGPVVQNDYLGTDFWPIRNVEKTMKAQTLKKTELEMWGRFY